MAGVRGPEKSENLKTHPLLVAYEQLSEEDKEANRVNVQTIPEKLAKVGYIMMPARGHEGGWSLISEEVETLAEFEHELWMRAKRLAGYVLGKPSSDEPRRNEYLVPWAEVPESVKRIDRDLV